MPCLNSRALCSFYSLKPDFMTDQHKVEHNSNVEGQVHTVFSVFTNKSLKTSMWRSCRDLWLIWENLSLVVDYTNETQKRSFSKFATNHVEDTLHLVDAFLSFSIWFFMTLFHYFMINWWIVGLYCRYSVYIFSMLFEWRIYCSLGFCLSLHIFFLISLICIILLPCTSHFYMSDFIVKCCNSYLSKPSGFFTHCE